MVKAQGRTTPMTLLRRGADAPQAPVWPRHCTQAPMQQPDQLTLDAMREAPEEAQGLAAEATSHELL